MPKEFEQLKEVVSEWIEDIDDALSDDPSGHDVDVRVGARWWDHDRKIREALDAAQQLDED